MVGMLQREEVDIQLGALIILAAREQVDDVWMILVRKTIWMVMMIQAVVKMIEMLMAR